MVHILLKREANDTFSVDFRHESLTERHRVLLENLAVANNPLRLLFNEFTEAHYSQLRFVTHGSTHYGVRFLSGTYGEAAWLAKTAFERFMAELWQHEKFRSFCDRRFIEKVTFESWQPFDDIMFWMGGMRADELATIREYAQRRLNESH